MFKEVSEAVGRAEVGYVRVLYRLLSLRYLNNDILFQKCYFGD